MKGLSLPAGRREKERKGENECTYAGRVRMSTREEETAG